jgi:hypothetical protein
MSGVVWPPPDFASSFRPPRVAALFELRDDVIGDGVALVFAQAFLQAANDFPRPA